MLGWLNASLKSTETRDELSTTLYLQSEKYKLCQDACQRLMLHPTPLPQEQAAKTKMLAVVRIQQKEYLGLCTVEEGVAKTLHMTDHAPMQLENHYTCWIEGDGIYPTNPFLQGWLQAS